MNASVWQQAALVIPYVFALTLLWLTARYSRVYARAALNRVPYDGDNVIPRVGDYAVLVAHYVLQQLSYLSSVATATIWCFTLALIFQSIPLFGAGSAALVVLLVWALSWRDMSYEELNSGVQGRVLNLVAAMTPIVLGVVTILTVGRDSLP